MQKSSQFPAAQGPKAQQDAKAKLEEFLLGNKSAAREMMQRHSRVTLGNYDILMKGREGWQRHSIPVVNIELSGLKP